MIARRALLVLLPLLAACSARKPQASVSEPAPRADVVMLDEARITQEDVGLIDPTAIESVAVLKGDEARLRFGGDTRSAVQITTRKARRGSDAYANSPAPLFLVDGRVIPAALLNVLDTRRIEKIDVIKGKRAEEQYGERARSGVVMITTKGLSL